MDGRIAQLSARRTQVHAGPAAAQRRGLSVRERLDLLLDPDSFHEIEPFRRHTASGFGLEHRRPETDGVVTGWGLIHGRQVCVYAQDPRIFGGSLGAAHAEKIHKVMDLALSVGAPLIGLNDGGGARIQEGVAALAGYGGIFQRNVKASGRIPQISVILGACAGGAAYSPALTDFVFMVTSGSSMFLTGPDVVAAVTGERLTQQELGGAAVHARVTGQATFVHEDEESCLADVRYLVSLLPSTCASDPPWYAPEDDPGRRLDRITELVPTSAQVPYDMRAVAEEIVDDGDLFELHEGWAPNVLCALARLDGHVVGIVGNQPMASAGVLDLDAAQKAARFVGICDAFGIPLITLVDVPGFLPGRDQEHRGAIRHGAKLLYAYCQATVPRIQVIVRKAYGGAYIVMDSRSIGSDLSFAWPTNEIAVMGAEGAADVIFRRRLAAADDPTELRRELVADYRAELMHPFYAAERGLVDDVIDPRDTRRVLVDALALLRSKGGRPQWKHANPPL